MNPNSGHNLIHAGPINAVNMAQMTRPDGIHIPYVVSLIKINIFSIFHPKMWKFTLRSMATSKSYNSGTLEDTCTLFSGSTSLTVVVKFVSDQPRRHGNENLKIFNKNAITHGREIWLLFWLTVYCCLHSVTRIGLYLCAWNAFLSLYQRNN